MVRREVSRWLHISILHRIVNRIFCKKLFSNLQFGSRQFEVNLKLGIVVLTDCKGVGAGKCSIYGSTNIGQILVEVVDQIL